MLYLTPWGQKGADRMRTILFVDDEPHILNAYRRSLQDQRQDWELHFLESAEAALDFLQTRPVDAIISDVKMPGMDGLELLGQLHALDGGGPPVIIVTGLQDHTLKRRALDLGAADLLDKPLGAEDLVARLRSVLRIRHYQEALQTQNDLLESKVRERTQALEKSNKETVMSLARAAEYRDEDTGGHVFRVSQYCKPIAKKIGMSEEEIETIFIASALHDLGKIGIPDRVLLKPGKLTGEEWDIVKQHCTIGAGILRRDHPVNRMLTSASGAPRSEAAAGRNPLLHAAAMIVLSHHEKWDGSGYPHRLAGDQIPLEARIVALVDVYDALSTHRPYRAAMTEAASIQIIRDGVGSHFDPLVHRVFEESLEEIRQVRADFDAELGGL